MPPRKSTKWKHDNDEVEGSVNEQILTVLRSIDARLGRIERQGQQLGGRQPQLRLRDASASTTHTSIVPGSWKFKYSSSLESTLKSIHDKRYGHLSAPSSSLLSFSTHRSNQSNPPPSVLPTSAFGKVSEDGLVLTGDEYDYHSNGGHNHRWVNDYSNSGGGSRNLFAQLVFNDKAELNHKSGIYTLTIKYNPDDAQDAAIIIGEIEFHCRGCAIAKGADWDRLLNNQRQTQLPYSHGARGVATWQIRKISEPWERGEELKFKIDTNENTIVFQKGNTPAKTFWNVLAFTNNPKYPEYLRAFAYCGRRKGTGEVDVKLTIIP